MAWGGGVFTLHLYRIKHSVIPNWGTKVSLPNFAYQIYGDNRVNAFVALISVKYSLGKGKTTKLNNSKNLDVEK
jgi:hypothetical protein